MPAQNPAYAFVLGVDVSKDSLDICLINVASGQIWAQKTNNNKEGFPRMKAWTKQQGCDLGPETLVCLEHTGLYTRQLVHYLLARQAGSSVDGKFAADQT